MKCIDADCPELPKRFFEFKKMGKKTIMVNDLEQVFLGTYKIQDLFEISVKNKLFLQDYYYNVKEDNGMTIYTFEFKDRESNDLILFKMKDNLNLFSKNFNELPL